MIVGGFGESRYLRHELQKEFHERAELLLVDDPA